MQFKRIEKMVSLLIFSVILIAGTTVGLMGMYNQWFIDKVVYYTEFKTSGGLKIGSRVDFKDNAWEIGEVFEIKLIPNNNKIRVYYKILKEYTGKIREDSIVYLNSGPLAAFTGGPTLEISIGSERYSGVKENRHLPSSDSEEGKIMLADKKTESGSDIALTLGNIASNIDILTEPSGPLMQTLFNVESITREIKDGFTIEPVDDLIKAINVSVKKSLQNINNITDEIDGLVTSNVGRVDKTLLTLTDQVSVLLLELSKTVTIMLDKIIKKSDPILDDAQDAIRVTLKELTTSVSAISGSLENNMATSLKDISAILRNIKVLTARVNNIMDQVEKMPILGGDPKAQPLLIDQVGREEY